MCIKIVSRKKIKKEEVVPEENDAPRNVTSEGKLWLNIENKKSKLMNVL